MVILVLAACVAEIERASPVLVPLDGPALARRMSIDLRGVLPSIEELDAVEADPASLVSLREEWLESVEFEDRLVELYQESWGTRVDSFRGTPADFDLPPSDQYRFARAIGEEPLRLAARVVAEDRSYTELVTADWTMANELLGEMFPVAREGGASGWAPATYTDLRPSAGVLTTNGLWWRYISPLNNFNRARTAAILNLLVCVDVLSRPVVFSEDLSADPEAAEAAVREDPACLACHATIEPVAATLFGFVAVDDQSALEMSAYHAERELQGADILQVEPAWYGEPIEGLEGLGTAIAGDDRFVDCGVSTLAEGLLRRPLVEADAPMLRDVRESFVENDLRMKAAIRAITDTEAYRAGSLATGATAADLDTHSTRRILVSTQLRGVLADFAGLEWSLDGAPQLDWDPTGFRVLGGGVDGEVLAAPQQTPGLTWTLLVRRAAELAATTLVDHDFGGSTPRVLTRVTAETDPTAPEFTRQLADLHWRLLARRPVDATLAELRELWEAAAASSSPTEAWTVVIAALLRDPDFVAY